MKGRRAGELARLDRGGSPPLPAAAAAFLATLSGSEQRNTQRAYRSTLRALAAEFAPPGTRFPIAGFDTEENVVRLTGWFTGQWSQRAPATFNRHLDAPRSAVAFWIDQQWLTTDRPLLNGRTTLATHPQSGHHGANLTSPRPQYTPRPRRSGAYPLDFSSLLRGPLDRAIASPSGV